MSVEVGSCYGFRGWYLAQPAGGAGPALYGVRGHRWAPGAQQAQCKHTKELAPNPKLDVGHDIAQCTCGFYALNSPVYAPGIAGQPFPVLGVIAGWDEVVQGPLGWRASSAELVALVAPTRRGLDVNVRLALLVAGCLALFALWVALISALSATAWLPWWAPWLVIVAAWRPIGRLSETAVRSCTHAAGSLGFSARRYPAAHAAFLAAVELFPNVRQFHTPAEAQAWVRSRRAATTDGGQSTTDGDRG